MSKRLLASGATFDHEQLELSPNVIFRSVKDPLEAPRIRKQCAPSPFIWKRLLTHLDVVAMPEAFFKLTFDDLDQVSSEPQGNTSQPRFTTGHLEPFVNIGEDGLDVPDRREGVIQRQAVRLARNALSKLRELLPLGARNFDVHPTYPPANG